MRQQSHGYVEIHKALAEGERLDFVKAEEHAPVGEDGGGEGTAVAVTVSRLTAELAHTSGQLTATEAERDRLVVSMAEERKRLETMLAEERSARLEAEKVAATVDLLLAELERARLTWGKRIGK